jgi:hypothetical protein
MARAASRSSQGRYIFRYWSSGDDKVGVCFKETLWGSNKVRWVWLRFADGTEKAFAPSHLRAATAIEIERRFLNA